MCTRLVFGLFAMLALLWQPAARADVWAYVNDKGVPHFATERVDERYELYFSDQAPEDSTRAKAVPKVPEWERIVTEMQIVAERMVRGEYTPETAAAEIDRRADRLLEKRRWMMEQGRAV